MNRSSLLSRLRTNGVFYLISGVLLLIGIPLYQVVILNPAGLSDALNEAGTDHLAAYLIWISQHSFLFIIYRALLVLAFVLLFTLPFSLYRIIVAQEIVDQQEQTEDKEDQTTDTSTIQESDQNPQQIENDRMPAYAWRGRGFIVLAAWIGILSLAIYILGTIVSTLYLVFALGNIDGGTIAALLSLFTIITNTIGIGLLGLSTLFFGAMICRTGLNLWPAHWVIFGYAAILVGGMLCINAIGTVNVPEVSQNAITTIATLLFAAWVFCLGLILIRLQPEA